MGIVHFFNFFCKLAGPRPGPETVTRLAGYNLKLNPVVISLKHIISLLHHCYTYYFSSFRVYYFKFSYNFFSD
jgi:hypothetical protein